MYLKAAKRNGWIADLVDEGEGGRTALLRIEGKGIDRLLRESGIHKVQHKTKSRNRDRIHTSVVTVVVLPPAAPGWADMRKSHVRFDTFRGPGKGGQHRNVTDSAVRATHVPTGTTAVVTRGRSQGENKKAALDLLGARVAAAKNAEVERGRNKQRAAHAARADRAGAGRVYDKVRDMIRTADGKKVHGVKKVLDGDLSRV